MALVFLVLAASACMSASLVANPTETPSPAPTDRPIPPTVTPTPRPRTSAPAWWPYDLAMPQGIEFIGDAQRTIWTTPDLNVTRLKDFFVQEAESAGYQTHSVTLSEGSIYDLLFVRGHNAFLLNLTQGSDATYLTGSRVGLIHWKTTGVKDFEMDLPMRTHLDLSPGPEISVGTSVPNPDCGECQYFINVHIAPFKGPGVYDSKPGLALIDVQAIPGGNQAQEDYRWAKSCIVTVNNASSGSFDCKGLENIYDSTQRIDISGTWEQP